MAWSTDQNASLKISVHLLRFLPLTMVCHQLQSQFLCIDHYLSVRVVLYSGKFSLGPNFVLFALDQSIRTKIKHEMYIMMGVFSCVRWTEQN